MSDPTRLTIVRTGDVLGDSGGAASSTTGSGSEPASTQRTCRSWIPETSP